MKFILKTFLKFFKDTLYFVIDLFWLLWSPLLRQISSPKIAFFFMSLINASYPGWFYFIRKDRRSHDTLETYKKTFDIWDVDFYDKFVGANWFKNKTVLDLGAFVGGKAEIWARKGAKKMVGIDLSSRGIDLALKDLALKPQENLSFYKMSSTELAAREEFKESFDTIVSFTVFEHIETQDLAPILNDGHQLLKKGGEFMIVYNYFYDRFGAHAHMYFAHPWPQLLFREELIWKYCDKKIACLQGKGGMGYYPAGHEFSRKQDNDCFMHLNKLMPFEFDQIIEKSPFTKIKAIPYKRSSLVLWLHQIFPKSRFFVPSYLYILEK